MKNESQKRGSTRKSSMYTSRNSLVKGSSCDSERGEKTKEKEKEKEKEKKDIYRKRDRYIHRNRQTDR